MSQRFLAAMVTMACVVALPSSASAQSAFSGIVRDTSGAVLPGVTVEAASPALIEKVRTAITDENGVYRIVDLRPGVYTLTFSLPGFNTITQTGVELGSNFTATINVDLTVGQLQESVTVTGSSPIVDVQSNVKQQVISRDVLDAVPTAKTIQGLGQLVVGVTLNVPDVGGSRAMQQTYFAIRGQGGAQTVVMVDGLMTNGLMGDGAVQAYHNEAMTQEAVYQTAGGSAETLTGGVNLNLVPKDGGNQWSGGFKFAKSPASWQGNNLTDHLKSLGVTGVDRIANFYEWNVEQGGPIIRSKLWFFGAFRKARYDKPIANTFVTPEGVPFPQGFAQCRANPGSCEQGVSDEKMDNPVVRFTWQISERNKLATYMDRALRLRGHAMGSLTDPRTASVIWNTPTFATGSLKWTSTVSSRLLLENGFSFNRERYDNLYQPGIYAERGTEAWYRNVRKDDVSTGLLWNASSAQLGNYPDRYNLQSAASYVTGSHSVKVGVMYQWGIFRRWNNANADLYQSYQNGVPFRVTVLNTPLEVQEDLDANLGFYAQDSWQMDRMTLNYGLRWDYIKQRVKGQNAQVGRFANIPAYDDIVLPTWKNFSPRLSVIYDVSGNGRTAVRAGFNKFVTAATTGFAQLYNPTALTTAQLPWTDLNGDDIAQGERGCSYLTPGCEINFASLPANFGLRALSQFDRDLQRPYQLAFNAGINHEVISGLSVSFEYFRSDFRDITMRTNTLRDSNSYTPVDVVSPLDGRVITVYNVKREFAALVANVDSTNGDMKRWYNGFDLGFNARLRGGIRAFGGFNLERTLNDTCVAAVSDPNRLAYCDQRDSGIPWAKQFKATVVYPLPWYGVSFSAAWQSLNGYLTGSAAQAYGGFTAGTGFDRPNGLGTFWLVTPSTRYAANCQAPCTPGALVIPGLNTASLSVPLAAPETEYTPRINQVDLAFSKKVERGRLSMVPKIDIFNALNSDDYTSVVTTQFGAQTYLRPSTVLQGRIIRFGADIRW